MSVVLVTGASSGIGRAFAFELARQGRRVVLVARDQERLRGMADELPGGPHEVLAADLASKAGCDAVAARLEAADSPVDLLVNAAGLGTAEAFPRASLEREEAQLAVNVTAVMRLSWAAARSMEERRGGAIVNVASTAAIWSAGTYAASKAWVLKASEGLAEQTRGSGTRVICVIPGFTRTEFHDRARVDNREVAGWLWLTAETVARESLAALERGEERYVPSRRYRVLTATVGLLPAAARRAALRRVARLSPRPPGEDAASPAVPED